MSKKFISFVVVILIFFLGTNLFAQEKIAFIDLNFVYSNSKIGKKMIKEISNKQENINKDFKDFQNKLDKEKEKLLSQKNVLAEDIFPQKYFLAEKVFGQKNFQ